MSEKNILPGFIKKILGGVEESDRRVTSRKTKELLDEETHEQENPTADPFRSAAELVKSKKKKKEKRHFLQGQAV